MKNQIQSLLVLWGILTFPSITYATPDSVKFVVEKSPVIAFSDVRVIDGTGAPARENQTVIVRDGYISHMGESGKVPIPENSKRISLRGKSLLPGWVMTHEHLYYIARSEQNMFAGNWSIDYRTNQSISFPRLYLAAGVTSARTAGSVAPDDDLMIKASIAAGSLAGPDFDLTSPFIRDAVNPADARARVRFWVGQGFSSIKLADNLTMASMASAVDEAHELGVPVIVHSEVVTYTDVVKVGADQIEHGFAGVFLDLCESKKKDKICPDSPQDIFIKTSSEQAGRSQRIQAIYDQIIDNGVFVTSTLGVLFRPELPKEVAQWFNESGRRNYKQFRKYLWEPTESARVSRRNFVAQLEFNFWKAGGKLTVGSDAAGTGVPAGYGNLIAIELLADTGIPPLEVIKIATKNGAESMGISHDRGTIAVGKRADLIVIKGDPSTNIKDIRFIETVYKNGIGYDAKALNESAIGTIGGPG